MSTTSSALTIAVIAGGISHERDVSLRSGRRLAEALTEQGHRVVSHDLSPQTMNWLAELAPDVVWPTVHGATGEDGALQAMLAARGFRFVGSDAAATALAWNKPTAKTLARRAGIPTPDWMTLPRDSFRELGAAEVLTSVEHALGSPCIVKPARGGSAQGVTVVDRADAFPHAMVAAFGYGDQALVERAVPGVELAVTVLDTGDGPTALPAVEIRPRSGWYSFEARYNAGETVFYAPARVSADIAEAVGASAVAMHSVLGLGHLSRIDFLVDDDGQHWYIDTNTAPGFTDTSLAPLAIESTGNGLGTVLSSLAEQAAQGR